MTDYDFKYRIQQAPEATSNGSGMIAFDMYSVSRVTGSAEPFSVVPGYHQTAIVPAASLKVVNDMPHSNASQRNAKNTACKNLLSQALGISTYSPPPIAWDIPSMEAYMDANDAAKLEATRLNDYVVTTLGMPYPLDLTL
jgi:hypothetical protein